jgi:hypothetical protein
MFTKIMTTAAAALVATVTAAGADTISESYTAVNTGTGPYLPTINDDGGAFLSSPYTQSIAAGTTTTPSTFLQVAPANGGSGTLMGGVAVAMKLTDGGAAVTGVTSSNGAGFVSLANGAIDFSANYDIYYGNQTDCITWSASSCTPNDNTTTIGDTLTVSFANDAVLAINLYNWSDWDMQPDISFNLISGPGTPVPEPASLAIFGVALAGLTVARRHLPGAKQRNLAA